MSAESEFLNYWMERKKDLSPEDYAHTGFKIPQEEVISYLGNVAQILETLFEQEKNNNPQNLLKYYITVIDIYQRLPFSWAESDSKPLSRLAAITALDILVNKISLVGILPPRLSVDAEGGLTIQWCKKKLDLTIYIDPTDGEFYIHRQYYTQKDIRRVKVAEKSLQKFLIKLFNK